MSFTHTMIGGAMIFGVLQLGAWALLPPAPVFQINSLTVDPMTGMVAQDRTINTNQPAVTLVWTGVVEDAHGDDIQRCAGTGVRGYKPGRKVVLFTLEDWTGAPGCTFASLPPGQYRLRGSWRGGEVSTGAYSDTFEVE